MHADELVATLTALAALLAAIAVNMRLLIMVLDRLKELELHLEQLWRDRHAPPPPKL